MPKLSDSQLVVLSAACQREDRCAFPVTSQLKGNAAGNVLKSLLTKGLLEQVPAQLEDTVWRHTDEGARTLRATDAAFAALGIEDGADARKKPEKAAEPTAKKKPGGKKPASKDRETKRGQFETKPRKPREARTDSKQAQLIAMLKRAKGASIEEIVEAFDWQAHTVRGVIAGALKKKLGLNVTSEKTEGRGRVYRIAE
jgi:hypothetical protein